MIKRIARCWVVGACLVGCFVGCGLPAHAGAYEDFFSAIQKDDTRVMTTLLLRDFDPNTLDPNGMPALCLAIRDGSLKIAEMLLSLNKIKIELRSPQDENALMFAALGGHHALVNILIAKGADVNKTGWTPLHYAATKGHVSIIKLLLEKHAYIDAESPNKTTPLMMAAMYGTLDAVKVLLEEGADSTMKNEQNMTALDFATRANRADSIAFLTKATEAKRPKGSW